MTFIPISPWTVPVPYAAFAALRTPAPVGHLDVFGAAVYAAALTQRTPAGPHKPTDSDELLARFAPVLVLHPEEKYRPTTVEELLRHCALRFHHDTSCGDCQILDHGQVTAAALLSAKHQTRGVWPFCAHGGTPVRSTQPRDVLADEGFFLQQSRNTGRGGLDPDRWTFYGRVMPRNVFLGEMFGRRAVALQYWVLYAYNRSTRWGLGGGWVHFSHEGDWEHVTVVVEDDAVKAAWLATHEGGDWATPADDLQLDGTHPIVYASKGGHASYPTAGNQSRPDPLPDDETGEGVRSPLDIPITILGGRDGGAGQEWLEYAGLWGELGFTGGEVNFHTSSSGPYGPMCQPAWYKY